VVCGTPVTVIGMPSAVVRPGTIPEPVWAIAAVVAAASEPLPDHTMSGDDPAGSGVPSGRAVGAEVAAAGVPTVGAVTAGVPPAGRAAATFGKGVGGGPVVSVVPLLGVTAEGSGAGVSDPTVCKALFSVVAIAGVGAVAAVVPAAGVPVTAFELDIRITSKVCLGLPPM
jgi:hypothetical protein